VIAFSGYGHLYLNTITYLFIVRASEAIKLDPIALVLIMFGSLLPDIDSPSSLIGRWFILINYSEDWKVNRWKHRRFPHSLLGMITFSLPIAIYSWKYCFIFMASYLFHLFCDSTTKEGIKFLYPYKKAYNFGKIINGDWLFIIGLAMLLIGFL